MVQSEGEKGLRLTDLLLTKPVKEVGVLVSISDFHAEGSPVELLQIVFKGNIENAIVFVLLDIIHVSQLRRPEGRVVRPITGPFTLTPGVPHLHEPDDLSINSYLCMTEQRVSMVLDNTLVAAITT